jgi:hypothetical protein
MAHVQLRWRREPAIDIDVLRVQVDIGPDRLHLRPAGELLMHASEVNALDRLLQVGYELERPAHTYGIHCEEEVPA